MTINPTTLKRHIFHITHLSNLSSIVRDGVIWSDRVLAARAPAHIVIGYDTIKSRRLKEIEVNCHPGTFVGHFVPFYFCPRSPMLYVIWRRGDQLRYKGGQDEIVHLASTIGDAVAAGGSAYAFSDGNAGGYYTRFCSDLGRIDEFVDWNAVNNHDWRDPVVKERKQAEFLYHEAFPWTAVRAIGTCNVAAADRVRDLLKDCVHQPPVRPMPAWYY